MMTEDKPCTRRGARWKAAGRKERGKRSMMTEDENATLVMLAKAASRGSASYEYEIDTLREASRTLLEAEDAIDKSMQREIIPEGDNELRMLFATREHARATLRAAIDRTDWRAP